MVDSQTDRNTAQLRANGVLRVFSVTVIITFRSYATRFGLWRAGAINHVSQFATATVESNSMTAAQC